ncbi:MAG: ribonuclease P protein component [Bacteroidetes bacterium]|nr:MAG: ribonuclease P protein component [Bacteroidota bacterium]
MEAYRQRRALTAHQARVRFTLKKSEILRGSKNFERLLQHSKKLEGKFLRCYVTTIPREADNPAPGVMVAFAVKKTLKRAVDRNRVRRLMREAYRLHKAALLSRVQQAELQVQILFMYSSRRDGTRTLPSFVSVQDDVVTMLDKITMMV